MPEKNITFEIKEHLGVVSHYDSGWNKELNLISWNGGAVKFDIREWDEHHERMSRGVTLSPWEMRKTVDLYLSRNNDIAVSRGRAIEAERNARRDAAAKKRANAHNVEEREGANREERLLAAAEEASVEGALPPEEDEEKATLKEEQLPVEDAADEASF